MLIDCKDINLINYIENELDKLNIKYNKQWQSEYIEDFILDYEPFCTDGFCIRYNCNFKELHYINKIAKDFIAKREYLERCLCLK